MTADDPRISDLYRDIASERAPGHLEQLEHRPRVVLESLQPGSPGQAGAAAFGHQAADVLVGIGRPLPQHVEGGVGIPIEIAADAELGREQLGELVLGLHGRVEVVEPVLGHEVDVRQIAEALHTRELVVGPRRQRVDQDVQRFTPIRGQVIGEDVGHPAGSFGELEIVVALEAGADENDPQIIAQFEAIKKQPELMGDISLVADHIDHVVKLVGINHPI